MPRNGAGTMSIVNTASAGAVIASSDYNENFDDVAEQLTNSLALDGQSTMVGQIKAANGTSAAPALTFGSDTDTGAYRSAANEYAVAAGGTQITAVSASGLDVRSGNYLKAGAIVAPCPIGSIIDFAGPSAPAGWLFAGGQAVSRTTYALLFAVIGTTYGSGDGSTTFNLPDLCGRVSAGRDDLDGSSAGRLTTVFFGANADILGATGGSESHTLTTAQLPSITPAGSVNGSVAFTPAGSVTVTAAGTISFPSNTINAAYTPSGAINITDNGHAHNIPSFTGAGTTTNLQAGATAVGLLDINNNRDTDPQTTGISATFNGSSANAQFNQNSLSATFNGTQVGGTFTGTPQSPSISASFTGTPFGSGTAHKNVQPTIVLNKIIFAGA
jgi:microcystin-dependent protein